MKIQGFGEELPDATRGVALTGLLFVRASVRLEEPASAEGALKTHRGAAG